MARHYAQLKGSLDAARWVLSDAWQGCMARHYAQLKGPLDAARWVLYDAWQLQGRHIAAVHLGHQAWRAQPSPWFPGQRGCSRRGA